MNDLNQLLASAGLSSGKIALILVILNYVGKTIGALRNGEGLVGVWRSIVYGQGVPKVISKDYTAELKKPDSSVPPADTALILVLCGLLGFIGMGMAGCATLDATGPYKGDKALYVADTTLVTSYAVLDKFVTFEYQNREALAGQPAIKKMADSIRLNAPTWFQNAEIARDAYAAHPISSNLTTLQNSVQVIQAAISAASSYMIANPQTNK